MNLFQFWNTDQPPDEVAVLMESWKADRQFNYSRYNARSAEAYVGDHLGSRALAAYRRCAVPAMQADFFRYCALHHEGGVYVDADTYNAGGLENFIANAGRGMLMQRENRIANDFMFVRAAGDPLFEHVIAQSIKNIEHEISNNVWLVTGPGIMTQMYKTPEQRHLFDGFEFRLAKTVREIVQFKQKLAYKTSADDWRKNLSKDAPSIFHPATTLKGADD